MVKPKNQVEQSGKSAFLSFRALFGSFFGKGDLFYRHHINLAIDLQNIFNEMLNAVDAICTQQVFTNRLKYQPVCVGLININF